MPDCAHLLEGLLISALLGLFVAVKHLSVIVLHNLDTVTLVLIGSLVSFDIGLCVLDLSLEFFLFVVKLVLQSQEVLIQRNTVSQERFIATSLVLLVNFLVLKELDLVLHCGDLLVQIENDVVVNGFRFAALLLALSQRLDFVCRLLQVRVSLKFLVDNGACCSLINVIVTRCVLHIAGRGSTAASCSSYSA